MTINEAMKRYRLPNPTTPEDLEYSWSKVLTLGDKIVMTGHFYNGMNKPGYFGAAYEVFVLTEDGTVTRTLGNVESHPVFYEIRSILTDGSQTLTFAVDGSEVTVCGPLADGEVLYINTDNMTAWIETSAGVVRNALGLISELNFPYLSVGDSVITINANGGTFLSLTIYARSCWL